MRSLDVAAAVLEAVASRQPAGVTDIARHLALPKSTVHRILLSLRDVGWLAANEGQPTRWVLSSAIAAIGARYQPEEELRVTAPAVMAGLAAEVGETVHLAVADGRFVVLIDRIESQGPVRTTGTLGSRSPAHATAGGLAMLAWLPDSELHDLFDGIDLEALTPDTIADYDALMANIHVVRSQGFASVVGTRHSDVAAVGAAILGRNRRPIAAISISMPRQRYVPDRLDDWGRLVIQAAAACGAEQQSTSTALD